MNFMVAVLTIIGINGFGSETRIYARPSACEAAAKQITEAGGRVAVCERKVVIR